MALIEYTIVSSVATVSLNRAERRNALNNDMIITLTQLFEELADNEKVRVVILRGEGPCFCAGADIEEMKRRTDLSALESLLALVGNFPKPLVGLVHAAAIGGGLGLVACCDVVFTLGKTIFSLSEVRLGILPAVIMPYVKRKIGFSQLNRYMLTAECFDEVKAREFDLVHEHYSGQDELDAAVKSLCEELIKGAPGAQAASKQLLRYIDESDFNTIRKVAEETITRQRREDEAQEGLQAFIDKRPPSWFPQ